MVLRLVLAVVCCCSLTFAQNEGTYTIVAPKVLRPSLDYHVSISLHGGAALTNLVVAIEGQQDGGGQVRNAQSATVEPNSTQVIKFQIGELGPGKYNLTARGSGGLTFVNTTELEYAEKSHSVFIQTDKAIYKPGHLVQFRVIVVNPQLKPSVVGSLDIFMTDGKGNRIKQWNRVFTKQGVFASELQLSDQPVLGDWNITAVVSGQSFSKHFQVAEYILPKFEVTIDLPTYLTFNESKMVASIKAKYTYGKPVKGNVTIAAYPQYRVSYIQPFFTEPVRKTVQIDGKVDVDFNLFKELKLVDDFERDIRFDVTVIEGLTERKQNTSSLLTLYKYKYKMELIKTSDSFKPGLKYTAFLKLAYQDNTPIQDANGVVIVKHGFSHNQDEYNRTEYPVPRNGILELSFYPPVDENVYTLGIETQYQDLVEWFSTINRAQSPSNSFIQVVLKTENPKVNEEISIQVNSTAPLDSYTYEVMGRGNLIVARTVQAGNQMSHAFRFQVTAAMAPVARVVVYYVRADGEIVADALNFDVEGTFQNFVEIQVAPDSVEPGKAVDIVVKAKPNSYVGILGVDQSVLLLKTGNDISRQDVLDEVKSYDSTRRPDFASWLPEVGGRSFWWPSSATAGEVFSNSGTVVLTNGYIQESMPFVTYRANDQTIRALPVTPVNNQVDDADDESLWPSNSIRTRTRFPETWLWENLLVNGTDGTARFVKEAPDTITSWVITAFSLDTFHGLGVIEQPAKMQVFRPFFIQLNLPYSVIRGEVVAIQAVVFNYMNKEITAELTFENIGDFQFVDNGVEDNEISSETIFRKKSVRIPAQDGTPVSFLIRPTTLGHIDLRLTAKAATAGDAIIKKLLVKAEGETIYRNKAYLLDLRSSRSYTNNVTVSIPFNAVPGSQSVELSAIADIMGPSINNLNSLLRMPFGCGEQNMLLFVPNIVVTEYLKNTGQLTDAISSKALGFMETGYQKELTYKRDDGSFSAFGKSDASGSTWLTAFVARSFRQAQPYITIEDHVIEDALRWLSANQAPNGSFPEVGKVSHTDMQGGSGKGVPLTAYVLLAFLENKAGLRYGPSMQKAAEFLVKELPSITDPYAMALVTYALHLAEVPSMDAAFDMLQAKANNTEEEFRFWSKPRTEKDKSNPWSSMTTSVDVEMTAYALLSYLQRGLVTEALPIMRWMVAQRNSNGGFSSTQDTVIGLYALAKLAEKITVPNTNINVKIKHDAGAETFSLNRENAMILQKFKLPPKTTQVEISAVGSGFAIIQVSTSYNLNVTGEWPLFTLDPQLFKNANQNRMQLTICSSFVGEESNMAVMEISLPSGYVMDEDSLPSLRAIKDVKKVETKEGGTGISLYFDKMTRNTVCPTVQAYRVFKVAEQRKVPVVMYDYYDSSRRARVFYEPVPANVCDICQSSDCKNQCSSYPGWSGDEDGSKGWGTLDGRSNSRTTGGQQSLLPTLLCIVLSGLTSALLLI
ncbi:CD109 antigen isoform X3 [Daphnia magna]|uniref:TEP1-F n=1 Tax=Daphnia magna TaxID=35525 RepID=A0A0P5JA21_9CRUS|nr:CD109 antigen isoform X3 [Daphnia magna]